MASKTSYGAVPTDTDAKVDVVDDDESRPVFRDVPFSVAFFLHLGAMIYLGVKYGSFGLEVGVSATEQDDDFQIDSEEVEGYTQRVMLYMVLPCAGIAFVLAFIAMAYVVPACPKQMVAGSLIGTLVYTIVVGILMIASASSWWAYLGSAALIGITAYYVVIVWNMIPFAAANLGFSLKGVTANYGIYLVAIFLSAVSFVWTIFWFYVTIGLMTYESETEAQDAPKYQVNMDDEYDDFEGGGGLKGLYLFLLLVSLYWTSTVILNTVQVTVAGVMATYCFQKDEASGCCSPAVANSLYRSVTYSFGSICFGSLVQALVTALRAMVQNARNQSQNNDNGLASILLCILECILQLIEDIIEYFNQFAYVYAGIYGSSYLESGRRVVELFRARGWTTIVTNNLVQWVLLFSALTVSVLTGLIAMGIEKDDSDGTSYFFGSMAGPKYWAFGIGFIVGIMVSSVMTNVVMGAVNTLIVCYADAPAKLEENHAEDTRKMAEAWISVFPDCGVRPVYGTVI